MPKIVIPIKGALTVAAIMSHSTSNGNKTREGYIDAVTNFLTSVGYEVTDGLKTKVNHLLTEACNGKTKETGFKPYLIKNGDRYDPIL